jgi:DNA repair protein RadA/Sms
VYLNVAGGLKVVEPAVDLAIAVALASSFRDQPVDSGIVVAGEIGLSGEVRSVNQSDRRVREAQRMGFTRMVLPEGSRTNPVDGIAISSVSTVQEAINGTLGSRYVAVPEEDLFGEVEDE